MLLREVVETSATVAATRSRKVKTQALAALLSRTPAPEVEVVSTYLAGALRQRRTGLGWRSLTDLPPPATVATLTVAAVDAAFAAISEVAGSGSRVRRTTLTRELFAAATAEEQDWLRRVALGEVRQGALDALLQEAVTAASDVPLPLVRRAAMLTGSTTRTAVLALVHGAEAVAGVRMQVGTPLSPMLAASAPDVVAALEKAAGADGAPVAVETKLDGIRIQVHRTGDRVQVFTRSLDEVTGRLPEVVQVVSGMGGGDLVLDGEVLALGPDGRPSPFQETASRTATHVPAPGPGAVALRPYFFDLLHHDGEDLLDLPGSARLDRLAALVPPEHQVDRVVTAEKAEAAGFLEDVLRRGHEGVVVKSLDTGYQAGRRGSAWVKVKPVHTLDLVVLAVEWGSGRRRGKLSNIHLGARGADGGLVMLGKTFQATGYRNAEWVPVGKTFKGMTDEMLRWQTARFLDLETHREGNVVYVEPVQVVEVAFDGVQRSSRYSGGVALRFARVVRYRDDKRAEDTDTIDTLRALLP